MYGIFINLIHFDDIVMAFLIVTLNCNSIRAAILIDKLQVTLVTKHYYSQTYCSCSYFFLVHRNLSHTKNRFRDISLRNLIEITYEP